MKDWIQPTISVKMGDTCRVYLWGFPSGSGGKESAYSAGDPGSVPGSGRCPGEKNGWQPTPVFSPGKFRGQNVVSSSHFPITILTSSTLLLSLWHSLLLL